MGGQHGSLVACFLLVPLVCGSNPSFVSSLESGSHDCHVSFSIDVRFLKPVEQYLSTEELRNFIG